VSEHCVMYVLYICLIMIIKSWLYLVMEIITKVMSARKGKRTMSKYKESIRKYITSQFDDIIEEAKAELAAEEDGEQSANSLKEIQNLKDTMSRVLEVQLDGLTGEMFSNC